MKRFAKIGLIVLAFVMLLSMLLSFDVIAEPVGKMVGKPAQAVKDFARNAMFIAVGLILIHFGVLALPALAPAGVALIAAGALLLFQVVVPMLKPSAGGSTIKR